MAFTNPVATPLQGASGVALTAPFSFRVYSDANIDTSTLLQIYVNGVTAYYAGAPSPGFAFTVSSVFDGVSGKYIVSFTCTTHPSFTTKKVSVSVTLRDATSAYLHYGWDFSPVFGQVSNLTAKTWPDGKRIDLSWTLPAGAVGVKIRRSSLGYPRYIDDPGQDIYSGAAISAFVDGVYTGSDRLSSNKDLAENTFYYYTVFVAFDAAMVSWTATLSAEIQGLSIKDYYTQDGDYVYNLLPKEVRHQDGLTSRGVNQYDMQKYCRVIQAGVNLHRGWFESLLHMRDPDLMPAGRTGDGGNNYGILGAQLWDYGLPAGLALDAATMRKLALALVTLYENKGHCANLVTLAKTVTTWDVVCSEMVESLCGVLHLAYTWDTSSYITEVNSALSLANDANASVMGQVTIPTAGMIIPGSAAAALPALPVPAYIIDGMGTFACIASVAAASGGNQVITFTDPHAFLRKEITGQGNYLGTGYNYWRTTAWDPQANHWQFPFPAAGPMLANNAFVGYTFMDSAGNRFTITSLTYGGAFPTMTLSGVPVDGAFAIAPAFAPGGTFATRQPIFSAKIYTGEFTLTYDPRWDPRLNDETYVGPWSLISSFSSAQSSYWAPTPNDVVLVSNNGVGDQGKSTSVERRAITDTSVGGSRPWGTGVWTGYYLLPDWNQNRLFRITGNEGQTIFVAVAEGAPGLDVCSHPGSHYAILSEKDAIRYTNLVAMLPSFIP